MRSNKFKTNLSQTLNKDTYYSNQVTGIQRDNTLQATTLPWLKMTF